MGKPDSKVKFIITRLALCIVFVLYIYIHCDDDDDEHHHDEDYHAQQTFIQQNHEYAAVLSTQALSFQNDFASDRE